MSKKCECERKQKQLDFLEEKAWQALEWAGSDYEEVGDTADDVLKEIDRLLRKAISDLRSVGMDEE